MDIVAQAAAFKKRFEALRAEIGKTIVGHTEMVDGVLVCIFAGGHCLLEGVPGVGKTQLVKTLGRALDLNFSRIQFTPDLMPADVIGTNIITEDEQGRKSYAFRQGPIFSNLVLADEINRATPKTQSALLEAMQERSVTVWGVTHTLTPPMFVLATQNPIEMEGTYPLPEAQLDRFMCKLIARRSNRAELAEVIHRTTGSHSGDTRKIMDRNEVMQWQHFITRIVAAPHVVDFAVRLVLASCGDGAAVPESIKTYVRFGSSPRGAQSMMLTAKVHALLDGRVNVSYSDLRRVAKSVLRHRLVLSYQAQVDGISADRLVDDLLATVPETTE